MNRTQLPAPPDPNSPVYSGNPALWQRAAYLWMAKVKQQIETDSAVNIAPIGPLSVSTYTATATVTGTDALSNFVATMVTLMQSKGITAPTTQRN